MSWVAVATMAVGAVTGAAKNNAARSQADKQRQLASETQRYSYITHNQAAPVQEAGSMWGDVLQGGASGFGLGQGINSANNANKLSGAQTDYYKAQTNALANKGIDDSLELGKQNPQLYGGSGYKNYGNIG